MVKLYASFDDDEFLYLVIHFLPGGDLMTLLQREDVLSHQVLGFRVQDLGFRPAILEHVGRYFPGVFKYILVSQNVLCELMMLLQLKEV